jgi:DNA mismatch repair protein MutL
LNSNSDNLIRVLPLHVANKIAAGEVVERPASVAKELVENAIDAGAKSIRIAIADGGRKLVSVQDDGSGMSRADALLSLERQATSKILDVDDIEKISTLGFRGEAIPSIASVSRFSITTRRRGSDEGTLVKVNAGTVVEVIAAGCPPGTLVEVRDLFCNVPARKKFLRSAATEESHIKSIFTVSAIAHPDIAFSLSVDGREVHRLSAANNAKDRILDIFGKDFVSELLPIEATCNKVKVTGFIERPNLAMPSRRDQYIFVNGRPATAPSVAYAMREAYPRRAGDARPAAVIFIELPPTDVDVNVHPTKREVRFRNNSSIKEAIIIAIEEAVSLKPQEKSIIPPPVEKASCTIVQPLEHKTPPPVVDLIAPQPTPPPVTPPVAPLVASEPPQSAPVAMEFAIEPDSTSSKPWAWFKFLAQTDSGYLLIETDAGVVTVNPQAARERVAFEQLLATGATKKATIQNLLIPETVQMSPSDFARIKAALPAITAMGFALEEFGHDTYKIDAVPQLIGGISPSAVLATIARDLSEGSVRRGGDRWREELIAKSIARSFAGASVKMTSEGAAKLIEELCSCRMPYVCPRGKPVMIFTSTRELNRKFDRT